MLEQKTIYELSPTTDRKSDFLANRHGFENVAELALSLPIGANVLDVGAGASPFGKDIARLRPDITWTNFDYSYSNPDILEEVTEGAPDNLRFVTGDATKLTEKYNSEEFDAVFSYWLLPHLSIDNPEPAISTAKQIYEITKPDGFMSIGPKSTKNILPRVRSAKAINKSKAEVNNKESYADFIFESTELSDISKYTQKLSNEVTIDYFGTSRFIKKDSIVPKVYSPSKGEFVSVISREGVHTAAGLVLSAIKHLKNRRLLNKPFEYKAQKAWGTKATPLKNPISEFNVREGIDLNTYKMRTEYFKSLEQDFSAEEGHFYDVTSFESIADKLPKFEIMQDPETGQKLRFQRFNWPNDGDVTDKQVAVLNQQYSVSLDIDHVQYQNYDLASSLGIPMIVFENPGFGESDELTDIQKDALSNGEGFESIAEPMLKILESLGVNNINCIGYSMGADIAGALASMAVFFDIKVNSLLIFDSPTVVKQKLGILGLNFFSGGKDLNFAWKNPYNPVTQNTKLKPAKPYGLIKYGKALTKGTLPRDLRSAAISQPNMKIIIGSAGNSKISPKQGNNDLYASLKEEFPGRVNRVIIPGESHQFRDSTKLFSSISTIVLKKVIQQDI